MFEHEWKCYWGNVDPARIAYYPRLVNAMHEAGEEYLDQLGVSFWDVPDQYGIDLPVVAMDMEFRKPVEVGDELTVSVEPDMGTKSLGFDFTATHADGSTAFVGHEQHVAVDEDKSSTPLPDEFREILENDF